MAGKPPPDSGPIQIGDVVGLQEELDRINQSIGELNSRVSILENTEPEPPEPTEKQVLSPENIEYVGKIDIGLGGEFTIGMGLTIRARDNSFLALTHYPVGSSSTYGVYRIPIPPVGTWVNTFAEEWKGIGHGNFNGLFHDDANDRLWVTAAIDYPNDDQITSTKALRIHELKDAGQSVLHGPFGIPNKLARRWFGGITRIPEDFQQKYNTPPFLTGFGGYLSRISWGPAMGFVGYAIPDPIEKGLSNNTDFAAEDVKILADPGENSWVAEDGYEYPPENKTYDRGGRIPDTHFNFYDSGQFHDESTITQWKTAPDTRGRWTWGDQYGQNVIWLNTPKAHGIFGALIAHCGHTWYETSTLHYETKVAEFHIYDPKHLAEVAQGTRKPFELQPVHMWRPSEIPTRGAGSGNTTEGSVYGVCQHPETGLIYVRRTQAGGTWPNLFDSIYIYKLVNVG